MKDTNTYNALNVFRVGGFMYAVTFITSCNMENLH